MYNKYKNKKTIIDGIKFDSRKEAKRYVELKNMEQLGFIKDLELQKRYELQEHFRKNNKMFRKIEYVADFVYYDVELDQTIVEDTKGIRTEVYKIKRKLFEYKYPNLTIREL